MFKGLFGGESEDEREDIEEEQVIKKVEKKENTIKYSNKIDNNKMILFEPRAYSESQQIANYLKNNNSVIVNLKRVSPDQAKRIVDFLSGTIYAIEGGLEKLGGGIFLCTPKDVPVEGKISDETNAKASKKTKDEEAAQENNEMDW